MPPLPNNFGRALDLSALAKPKATTSNSPSTFAEATVENFMTDFVQLSKEKPVLLWAYTDRAAVTIDVRDLLARLESEDGGTWKFGAINVETQAELIQALKVQSLPYAAAFIAEQLLPLPDLPQREDQIRMVLTQLFKFASERGLKVSIPETPEPQLEPEELAALAALDSGDYSGAAMAYRNWLQRVPNEPMAKAGLALCELQIRIANLDFERTIRDADAKPESLPDQMMAADIEVATGRYKAGFERLLNSVRTYSGEERNRAKNHLLDLFQLVDPSDPELIQARKALASALF